MNNNIFVSQRQAIFQLLRKAKSTFITEVVTKANNVSVNLELRSSRPHLSPSDAAPYLIELEYMAGQTF